MPQPIHDPSDLDDPSTPDPAGRLGAAPMRRILVLALGWALILLGVAGLFLPLLQGVALIVVGLYVLSRESKTARRLLERLRERHPELYARVRRLRERVGGLASLFQRHGADPGDEVGAAGEGRVRARRESLE